jgi:tRNA(His) 5'-end guanylyltransferase
VTTDKTPQPGDTLGDRIKRYEAVTRPFLTPNSPAFIRVDGKAFHTWTRHMDKPFDMGVVGAMKEAAWCTSRQMQGFQLAYVQSDETTFMLTDYERLESEPWMGYNVNKLVSVTASMFTFYFNHSARELISPNLAPAFFDGRAFNVPVEDAPNAFLWRQRDWERNSLHMLARSVMSHQQLHGKKRMQVHDMLHEYGVNWAELDPILKNGTWIDRSGAMTHEKLVYPEIEKLLEPALAYDSQHDGELGHNGAGDGAGNS